VPALEHARIAGLVLAAGGSTRMGRPKQLIERGGRTLVRNAILAALEGGCDPVAVVVGAHAARVRREAAGLEATIIEHRRWREGLGSSIARGLAELRRLSDEPDAVMLLLCDQPSLAAGVVRRLARAWRRASRRAGTTMAACEYAGTLGTPAVFGRAEFARLAKLAGDRGAQRLLLESAERVARISWEAGATDLDRRGDCGPPATELL
jgi:molybdenum cofactor cytidylyltransferase